MTGAAFSWKGQVAFDKAEEAEATEELSIRYEELGTQLESLEQRSKEVGDGTERGEVKKRIAELKSARERLEKVIERETK